MGNLLKLPIEMLDQIVVEISRFDDKAATQTLYALALSCRSTLSSAQRELYRAPFRVGTLATEVPRAVAFLRTLNARRSLAKLVKDLLPLGAATHELLRDAPAATTSDFSPEVWQFSIVSACDPQHLSVYLTETKLAELGAKLVAPNRKLQHLKLIIGQSSAVHETFVAFMDNFSSLGKRRKVPRWEIELHQQPETSSATASRCDYSIRDLSLQTSCTSLDAMVTLLPLDTSRLINLDLVFLSEADVAASPTSNFLLALQHNRLSSLPINAQAVVYPLEEDRYHDQEDAFDLPPAFFSAFPHLTRLELKRFTGISQSNLRLLADSSPLLKSLNFDESLWTFTAEDFAGPAPSRGEQQLVDVLQRMEKLEVVDLGFLPIDFDDDDALEVVRAYCEGRGIRVSFAGFDEESEDGSQGTSTSDEEYEGWLGVR